MFQHKRWPEGFEFPSCDQCNQGTSDQDLLVSLLARLDPFQNKGNLDGKGEGLMKAVHRQFPGLLAKMMLSSNEARRHNKSLGIHPAPGQTHQQAAHSMKVPPEIHEAVSVFARKLVKGIFYKDTGVAFPHDGGLIMAWFSNEQLARQGRYPVFDILKDLGGHAPQLRRSQNLLNDQFEYKWSLSADKDVCALQARFGDAFGLLVFGMTEPGKLEAMTERIEEKTGKKDPFTVLQTNKKS